MQGRALTMDVFTEVSGPLVSWPRTGYKERLGRDSPGPQIGLGFPDADDTVSVTRNCVHFQVSMGDLSCF